MYRNCLLKGKVGLEMMKIVFSKPTACDSSVLTATLVGFAT